MAAFSFIFLFYKNYVRFSVLFLFCVLLYEVYKNAEQTL